MHRPLVVLISLFLVQPVASAQQPVASQERQAIRVDVGLVTLVATVSSRSGQFVGGLGKEDFRISEDSVPQETAMFEAQEVPISLGIVFDTSGSMVDKIDDVADAVLHFTRTVNQQDEIFVIRFSGDVDLVSDFTSDRKAIEKAVRRLRARGSTRLYDAIAEAISQVRQGRYAKKALLLITDGSDTASSATLQDALELAQKSEVLIYALGIGHSERGSFGHLPGDFQDEVDMRVLDAFAEATGGKSFRLEAAHSGPVDMIDTACLEVSRELRQQYMVSYYPTNRARDGSYRQIRVETSNPDQIVRTRRGYFAPRGP